MVSGAALGRGDRTPAALRLVAVLLAAAIGVLAVVWVLPGMLDWSFYRGALARFASSELGRPVRIDGPISVVLLPVPLVTAADVRLGDPGDGIAVAAPALRLQLAFAPLLLGRVVPRALVLRGAAITLPWPLPPSAAGRPAWLVASSARIEHGTLAVGALKLTDLDAELASGGAEAGIVVAGTARGFGQAWHFSTRLGAPDALGDTPLEAAVDALPRPRLPAPDANLRFVGTFSHDFILDGRVAAQAEDLSRLLPAPPVAARADGTIRLGEGPARAELNLSIGSVAVAATLRPAGATGRPVLSLTAGRLDLDAWNTALARLRAGQNAAGMITLPWPVSLEVSADAVGVRGGLIRGVHASLDVDGSHGVLHQATATLPGDASLWLDGTLTEDVFGLTLAGHGRLNAPQLRDTLAWLQACGVKLGDGLPQDVLRNATLAGTVKARRDGVELSQITGAIEGSAVTGRAAVETASGAVTADLTLDTLLGDNWIPPGTALRWASFGPGLAGLDAALKLRARTTRFRGHTIDGLALDAASSAGGVMINSLDATVAGVHGRLSGTIDANGEISDARADLDAPHATPLAAVLPAGLGLADYLWAGPIKLHAEATGPQTGLVASVSLDLADARLEARPTIDLTTGTWTARMTLRHPGAPRLLGAMGLPQARDWLGEGSLSMLGQASGDGVAVRLDNFDLTAGTLHATGDLQWVMAGSVPALTGHLAADTLPLPAFEPHSRVPVPLGWLAGWNATVAVTASAVTAGDAPLLHNATGTIGLAAGVVTLDGLKAGIGGGTLIGTARLDSASSPPHLSVRASIAGATLAGRLFGTPLDLATGVIDAQLDASAAGYSPAALTASIAGTASLAARAGTLAGIDPATPTQFDQLFAAATIANGIGTLARLDLATPDGPETGSGTLDLAAGTLAVRLRPVPAEGKPRGAAAEPRLGPSP